MFGFFKRKQAEKKAEETAAPARKEGHIIMIGRDTFEGILRDLRGKARDMAGELSLRKLCSMHRKEILELAAAGVGYTEMAEAIFKATGRRCSPDTIEDYANRKSLM